MVPPDQTLKSKARYYWGYPIQASLWYERPCPHCGVRVEMPRRQGRVACPTCRRRGQKESPAARFWHRMKTRARLDPGRPSIKHLAAVLEGRWAYYGGKCWMCWGEATEWDHVKPLRAGGAPLLGANLRPSCAPCNQWKRGRWPWVLLVSRVRIIKETGG